MGLRLSTLVRRLRRGGTPGDGCSDADLLARFARARDDAAFELLVWRHGAMVLSTCRRLLGHDQDAEDAFQAVFLVLARKGGGITRGTALPAWLHRVAVRVAARLGRSRRRAAPLEVEPPAEPQPDPAARAEALVALDEEIDRLPERCRRAVVLCYLEGLTAAEVAGHLGCPTGTVESRLAAARKKLRDRLGRRGVALPAAVAGQAALAPEAVARVAAAAVAFARGGVVANEASVRLAREVLTMWQARAWAAGLLVAAILAVGTGVGWAHRPAAPLAGPDGAAGELPTAPAPQAKDAPPAPADAWPLARQLAGLRGTLVRVAPDNRTLVLHAGQDVFGINIARERNRSTFRIESPNPIEGVAVSPDGKYVATAEGIQGVKLRDAATGEVLEALWPSGKLPAERVGFTPDGSRLVALGIRYESPPESPRKGKGVPADTKSTAFAQISVWDVAARKELGHPVESTTRDRAELLEVSLPDYQLSRDARFVFRTEALNDPSRRDPNAFMIGGERAPLRVGFRFTVIDALTGKAGQPVEVKDPDLSTFSRGPGGIGPDSVSPDGKTIAMRANKNPDEVRLIDLTTGKERARLSRLLRPVGAVAFSPDGRYFAASSTLGQTELAAPSEVVIWDAAGGKELTRLSDKDTIRGYIALRFSPDGSFLVAQDSSGVFTIWGKPPEPEPEAVKPPAKGKEPPTPPAPSGVPDRFQALIQSLSAAAVTDQRRVEAVFLAALGRLPTDVESRTLTAQLARQADKAAALRDLLNTLVDTAEFKAHAEALRKLSK
jgi:RNA polymerase sigma factor (sigma-70 family)